MARTHSCHHTMVIRAIHGPPVTWAPREGVSRGDVVTFVIFVITFVTIATTAGTTHTCKLYQIRSHGGHGGGGRVVIFISQQVSTRILKLSSSVSRTTLYLLVIVLPPSLSFSLSLSLSLCLSPHTCGIIRASTPNATQSASRPECPTTTTARIVGPQCTAHSTARGTRGTRGVTCTARRRRRGHHLGRHVCDNNVLTLGLRDTLRTAAEVRSQTGLIVCRRGRGGRVRHYNNARANRATNGTYRVIHGTRILRRGRGGRVGHYDNVRANRAINGTRILEGGARGRRGGVREGARGRYESGIGEGTVYTGAEGRRQVVHLYVQRRGKHGGCGEERTTTQASNTESSM